VGSAGAALIAVQFVVITFIATVRGRATAGAVSAFATPTVVHLGATLVISAAMSAPWATLYPVTLVIVVCGVGGLFYVAAVMRRARRQAEYEPVWQDWLWHGVGPGAMYAVLAVSPLLRPSALSLSFDLTAAAVLCLVIVGIHNAWDTVTHMVVVRGDD
jgi:hypothetical protein